MGNKFYIPNNGFNNESTNTTTTVSSSISNSVNYNTFTIKSAERVFYGPASVAIVDREGDRITGPALKNAMPQLLARRQISLNHLDILPGIILEDANVGGTTYKTEVRPVTQEDMDQFSNLSKSGVNIGDEALFLVGRIYVKGEDAWAPYCDEVWDGIQKGELNAFSISGQTEHADRKMICEGFSCKVVNEITKIALSAVTLCPQGMNQAAQVVPLSKSASSYVFAPKGLMEAVENMKSKCGCGGKLTAKADEEDEFVPEPEEEAPALDVDAGDDAAPEEDVPEAPVELDAPEDDVTVVEPDEGEVHEDCSCDGDVCGCAGDGDPLQESQDDIDDTHEDLVSAEVIITGTQEEIIESLMEIAETVGKSADTFVEKGNASISSRAESTIDKLIAQQHESRLSQLSDLFGKYKTTGAKPQDAEETDLPIGYPSHIHGPRVHVAPSDDAATKQPKKPDSAMDDHEVNPEYPAGSDRLKDAPSQVVTTRDDSKRSTGFFHRVHSPRYADAMEFLEQNGFNLKEAHIALNSTFGLEWTNKCPVCFELMRETKEFYKYSDVAKQAIRTGRVPVRMLTPKNENKFQKELPRYRAAVEVLHGNFHKAWVPFRGPRGGDGARNTETGQELYGEEARRVLMGQGGGGPEEEDVSMGQPGAEMEEVGMQAASAADVTSAISVGEPLDGFSATELQAALDEMSEQGVPSDDQYYQAVHAALGAQSADEGQYHMSDKYEGFAGSDESHEIASRAADMHSDAEAASQRAQGTEDPMAEMGGDVAPEGDDEGFYGDDEDDSPAIADEPEAFGDLPDEQQLDEIRARDPMRDAPSDSFPDEVDDPTWMDDVDPEDEGDDYDAQGNIRGKPLSPNPEPESFGDLPDEVQADEIRAREGRSTPSQYDDMGFDDDGDEGSGPQDRIAEVRSRIDQIRGELAQSESSEGSDGDEEWLPSQEESVNAQADLDGAATPARSGNLLRDAWDGELSGYSKKDLVHALRTMDDDEELRAMLDEYANEYHAPEAPNWDPEGSRDQISGDKFNELQEAIEDAYAQELVEEFNHDGLAGDPDVGIPGVYTREDALSTLSYAIRDELGYQEKYADALAERWVDELKYGEKYEPEPGDYDQWSASDIDWDVVEDLVIKSLSTDESLLTAQTVRTKPGGI